MATAGAQSAIGTITITTTVAESNFLRGTNEGRNDARVAPLGIFPCKFRLRPSSATFVRSGCSMVVTQPRKQKSG